MFGQWKPGQKSETKVHPLLQLNRESSTFPDDNALTYFIDGNKKATLRKRWIWKAGEQFDNSQNTTLSRERLVSQHIERFLITHGKHLDSGFIPTMEDMNSMVIASKNGGALGLHFGAFVPTLMSQMTEEQKAIWIYPAFTLKIVGCLAQTELGHGSNVRALQTTATYDIATQEFIVHSPNLQAMKWWPGGLGKTSTHCALYAQLIVNGKNWGVHTFLVQLRDENHAPLPGIELGEVGTKIGDNCTETGYLRLHHVRIPRDWMMMKNQWVTPDGKYERRAAAGGNSGKKSKANVLQYSTMLTIRASLVISAGYKLSQGVTIAIRYSCVRQQGFVNPSLPMPTHTAPENSILDYQVQQARLFKQLAVSYAFIFTGQELKTNFVKLRKLMDSSDDDSAAAQGWADLPELHASSAGLKSLCTFLAAQGLEDCRKCCGGHGVLLASGVAPLTLDYTTYVTAEGDKVILQLQCARFLMRQYALPESKRASNCSYMSYGLQKSASRSYIENDHAWFTNISTLLRLFQERASYQVTAVAQRLAVEKKAASVQGCKSPADVAWNQCALDLVDASQSHCFCLMLQAFYNAVKRAKGQSFYKALHALCRLFGLQHIDENRGNFGLTMGQGSLVRREICSLLQEIRPDAIALTDAFEFPDNVLNSAIGRYDGNVYESLYASAKNSPLNDSSVKDSKFLGYQYLKKRLDPEFLKEMAAKQRSNTLAKL